MKQGKIKLVVNGKTSVVTSTDGVQTVERGAAHEWMRADVGMQDAERDDDEVVVEEWTDPGMFFSSPRDFEFELVGLIEWNSRWNEAGILPQSVRCLG